MEERKCTICKKIVGTAYCGDCGQKIGDEPLSLVRLIADFIGNIFTMERSVFSGVIQVFRDPQAVVENYRLGYRGYFPSPGKMLFYALALAALSVSFISESIMGINISADEVQSHVFFWILILPLLILSSFLCFWKRGKGFTHHILSMVYASCASFLLLTILTAIMVWMGFEETIGAWMFLLFLLTVFLGDARVYLHGKSFWLIPIFAALEMLCFACVVVVLGAILWWFFPESISLPGQD